MTHRRFPFLRYTVALALAAAASSSSDVQAEKPVAPKAPNQSIESPPEFKSTMLEQTFKGYKTAFVFLDPETGKYFRYNPDQCKVRISPCSTFKIFSSLVGLETGVLRGKDHLIKWDGKKHHLDSWNQDQTLESAVKNSAVWYFQKVAELVGQEKMKHYLEAVHYGNEDMSGGLTKFWLTSSLSISADEQVDFLKQLYNEQLPFKKKNVDTVKSILEVASTDAGKLYGKTGSHSVNNHGTLGWFVGWVNHKGHPYIFATNIQAKDNASGRKARQLTESLMKQVKLL